MFSITFVEIFHYVLFANLLYGSPIEVLNPRNRSVSNNDNKNRVRVNEGAEYIPEGADIFLSCPNNPSHVGNNQFLRCIISHNQTCTYEQEIGGTLKIDSSKCNGGYDQKRVSFIFNSTYCAFHLKSVIAEDAGKWKCILETNGSGQKIYSEIEAHISTMAPTPMYIYPTSSSLDSTDFSLLEFDDSDSVDYETYAGYNVVLYCAASQYYGSCIFSHIYGPDNICKVGWNHTRIDDDVGIFKREKILECNNNTNIFLANLIGGQADEIIYTDCALYFQSISLIDAGDWFCDLESLDRPKSIVQGIIKLEIVDNKIVFPITKTDISGGFWFKGLYLYIIIGVASLILFIGIIVIILVYYKRKTNFLLEEIQQNAIMQNDYEGEANHIYEEILYEGYKGGGQNDTPSFYVTKDFRFNVITNTAKQTSTSMLDSELPGGIELTNYNEPRDSCMKK